MPSESDKRVQIVSETPAEPDGDDNQTFASMIDSFLPRGDDGAGATALARKTNRRSTKARTRRLPCIAPLVIVILVMIGFIILFILAAGPMHCACDASYKLGSSCDSVKKKAKSVLENYGKNCIDDTLNECLFKLDEIDGKTVKAFGYDQKGGLKYCLAFELEGSTTCNVDASSKVCVFYVTNDDGQNLCMIHKFMLALTDGDNAVEIQSAQVKDSDCSGLDKGNCESKLKTLKKVGNSP